MKNIKANWDYLNIQFDKVFIDQKEKSGFCDYLRTKCQPLEKKRGKWFISYYYINNYKYFQFPSQYSNFSKTLNTDIPF